jgi:hypothetical protein
LRELPVAIKHLADQAAEGKLQVRANTPDLKLLREQLKQQQKQRFLLAVGLTAAISGTLILTLDTMPGLGWVLIVAGILSLIGGRPPSGRH